MILLLFVRNGVHHNNVAPAKFSHLFYFWVANEMKQCHYVMTGSGCKPLQNDFDINLVVFECNLRLTIDYVSAPLQCYTGEVGSDFGNSGLWVTVKSN